jgi:hypothetical protein
MSESKSNTERKDANKQASSVGYGVKAALALDVRLTEDDYDLENHWLARNLNL